jgi:hypothetical protein
MVLKISAKFLSVLALVALSSVVHAQSSAPTSSSCVAGSAGVAPIATITFVAPTMNTDGSTIAGSQLPLSYQIFQGSSPTTLAKVATVSASPATVTVGLTAGTTAYFAVAVVDALGNSSPQSNVVCKSFPGSAPNTITITIS